MTTKRNGQLPTVTAVIPCFNAGSRLAPVARAAAAIAGRVIIVDDGSTDDGVAALEDGPWLRCGWTENRGKGYALIEGFRRALEDDEATHVCVLDADGQHDPGELPKLYAAAMKTETDLLIGARRFDAAQTPLASRIGNRTTAWALRRLLGDAIHDTQSGYRLHTRRLASAVVQQVEPGRYETEMRILALALSEGFVVAEAPIATLYERGNPSSHFRRVTDSWRVCRALIHAAAERRRTRRNS